MTLRFLDSLSTLSRFQYAIDAFVAGGGECPIAIAVPGVRPEYLGGSLDEMPLRRMGFMLTLEIKLPSAWASTTFRASLVTTPMSMHFNANQEPDNSELGYPR